MKHVSEILKKMMENIDFRKYQEYDTIFRKWDYLAGEKIAAHSSIKDIEKDFILVEVDHPGWMQLLQMKETSILARIRRNFPELGIRGLKVILREIDTAK